MNLEIIFLMGLAVVIAWYFGKAIMILFLLLLIVLMVLILNINFVARNRHKENHMSEKAGELDI